MSNPPPAPLHSSGDLIADRRYGWAMGALQDRDGVAATDLFTQVLELVPHWPPAWFGLAQAYDLTGETGKARAAYAKVLALAPADSLGASLHLARLDAATPQRPPDAYVRDLFDAYAPRFEQHLVGTLSYCGPALLRSALHKVCSTEGRDFWFSTLLDLGCGTGLTGRAMADCCDVIKGCDLAPAMVAAALASHVYTQVGACDLVTFLQTEPAQSADLVMAADVLVYVGALEAPFAAIAKVLQHGGLFAASVQTNPHENEGFSLGADLRFAHTPAYIHACAQDVGLRVARLEDGSVRREQGADVPGLVFVLSKV